MAREGIITMAPNRFSLVLPFAALLGLLGLSACDGLGACTVDADPDWTGGGDGGAPAVQGPPHPIVLAHGMFGTDRYANVVDYWFEIPSALADAGHTQVFVTAVDPLNNSTVRGAQLAEQIEDILAYTGRDKVVIIGHSQGGLDARVVAHDHPDMVAAVVTLGTPHGGSPLGQIFVDLLENPVGEPFVDLLEALIGPLVFDEYSDETDLFESLHMFTPEGVASFEAAYPDVPGIDYFAIAGRSSGASSSVSVCRVPGGAPEFISRWDGERDPLVELAIAEPLVSPFGLTVHDGVVPTHAQKHGTFLGCIPADHLDEVGQLFGDGPGTHPLWGKNDFDYQEFFVGLADFIRAEGY